MSNEKKIVRSAIRRTLPQKLNAAVASKPTHSYLKDRGLTVDQIKNAVSPEKQSIIQRQMEQNRPDPKPLNTQHRPSTAYRPISVGNAILLTGGLGDVFAVESYFLFEQKRTLKTVYYATRQYKAVREMFECIPRYKDVQHVVLWDDFRSLFAFYTKTEVYQKMRAANKPIPPHWNPVVDHSIATIFPLINSGKLTYSGSSLIDSKVADISSFNLPDNYVVVCPCSINDNGSGMRNFDASDWDNLFQHLDRKNRVAVVLNQGGDVIPQNQRIIDLSNKTKIGQAVEIMKKGKGYFGIDSAFSVIASKLFDPPDLLVKTKNPFLRQNKHIYYSPKKSFVFVQEKMEING
jgi:hypothetical protein